MKDIQDIMEERLNQLENKIEELTKINEAYRKRFNSIADAFKIVDNNCNLLNKKIMGVATYVLIKEDRSSFVKNVADVFCLKGLFE